MKDRQFSPHNCDSSVQMEDLRLAWTDHHIFCSAQSFYVTDAILHRKSRSTSEQELATLMQLRILRRGFLQDRNVGVGIFPEREEVLIGNAGISCFSLRCESAART